MVNVHTSYVWMLAKTGHEIFLLNSGKNPVWDERNRPKPNNVYLIEGANVCASAIPDIVPKIDVIILQDTITNDKDGKVDIQDRLLFEQYNKKKIVLFHNSFQTHFRGTNPLAYPQIKKDLEEKLKGIKKVFISEFKKSTWGMDGDVILPCIDKNNWGGWNGTENAVISVVNNFMYRDFMNNYRKTAMALANLKWLNLGDGEGQSGQAKDFSIYQKLLKDTRFMICLNNPAFEDGYNLSLLEYMSTGGCPVTLDHPTSPIEQGLNGMKSNSLNDINKFLHTCDYETAYKYGKEARKSVIENFPVTTFINKWNDALEMK